MNKILLKEANRKINLVVNDIANRDNWDLNDDENWKNMVENLRCSYAIISNIIREENEK